MSIQKEDVFRQEVTFSQDIEQARRLHSLGYYVQDNYIIITNIDPGKDVKEKKLNIQNSHSHCMLKTK